MFISTTVTIDQSVRGYHLLAPPPRSPGSKGYQERPQFGTFINLGQSLKQLLSMAQHTTTSLLSTKVPFDIHYGKNLFGISIIIFSPHSLTGLREELKKMLFQ